MAKLVPARELRNNLRQLLDDVTDRRDHVLVTRNGRPAAALVPIDEYQDLEETAEILSDADTLAAIEAGLSDIERATPSGWRAFVRSSPSAEPVAERLLASSSRAALDARCSRSTGHSLVEAVEDALGLLEREPHAGHVLRGRLRGLRSLRVGS